MACITDEVDVEMIAPRMAAKNGSLEFSIHVLAELLVDWVNEEKELGAAELDPVPQYTPGGNDEAVSDRLTDRLRSEEIKGTSGPKTAVVTPTPCVASTMVVLAALWELMINSVVVDVVLLESVAKNRQELLKKDH